MNIQSPVAKKTPRLRNVLLSGNSAAAFASGTEPHNIRSGGATWLERAVGAYQQSLPDAANHLRTELDTRLAALIGQQIHADAVYVNTEAQLAVTTIDGIVFRLRHHELKIMRRCHVCGTGEFESPTIVALQDIGHALTAWEPRCAHCTETDPINWLDLEG